MTDRKITWTTSDFSRERIAKYFGLGGSRDGEKWIVFILAKGREGALAHCESRASGAWDANERESHAVYKSLATLIRKGEI